MGIRRHKKIRFYYQAEPFYFPERNKLKSFLMRLFQKEGIAIANIIYVFCTDAYLLELNRNHLNHDTYTDIITFDLSDAPQPKTAEIYISIERVKENAAIYSNSFLRELHRVIFHGALHLSGYKDKTRADSIEMRSKEDFYLARYFNLRGSVSRGTKNLF